MRHLVVSCALLATLTAAAGGCVTKKKYNALESQYEQLNVRYASLQSTESGLRLTVTDLEDQIEILQDSNVYLASFYTDLLNEFRPQLDTDEVELIVYPDRMSLALSEDLSFGSGSSKLTDDGGDTITRMAELIARHPNRRFAVEGHTDSVPIAADAGFDTNWDLGAARAVAVVEKLIAAGAPADQLTATTYAETEPLAANGDDASRETNRRVEISFQPTLDELPGHEALLQAANVTYADGATPDGERQQPPHQQQLPQQEELPPAAAPGS